MLNLTDYLHICTTDASAGAVKRVLKHVGTPTLPPVIWSDMMENVGPPSLLDQPGKRFDWFVSLGFDLHIYQGLSQEGPEAVIARWESFWLQIDNWNKDVVFWFSRKSAQDRSLLTALKKRISTQSLVLVDVGLTVKGHSGVTSVAELAPEDLVLWFPQASQIAPSHAALASERAPPPTHGDPIRLLCNGDLTESTIETSDARILSALSGDWSPLTESLTRIPGAFGAGGFRDLDFSWLLWRLDELQRSGKIERRGGNFDPEFLADPLAGEVRLRA